MTKWSVLSFTLMDVIFFEEMLMGLLKENFTRLYKMYILRNVLSILTDTCHYVFRDLGRKNFSFKILDVSNK